jgi:hypothetical protein
MPGTGVEKSRMPATYLRIMNNSKLRIMAHKKAQFQYSCDSSALLKKVFFFDFNGFLFFIVGGSAQKVSLNRLKPSDFRSDG